MNNEKLRAALMLSEKSILPFLAVVEREAGVVVKVEVSIIESGCKLPVVQGGCATDVTAEADIRVSLKETGVDRRYRFKVECRLSGIEGDTGYSGFSMRGTVSIDDEKVVLLGRTNNYNVWAWPAEFSV